MGDGPAHTITTTAWRLVQAHNEVSGFDTRYRVQVGALRGLQHDFQENSWINAKVIEPDRWGTYRRFETGWMRMGKGRLHGCSRSTDLEASR